jgi:hypothetical protein
MTDKLKEKLDLSKYYFISSMMIDGYDFVYRSVPPTSYTQYISARTALNLLSPHTDTLGSSDFMEYFFCFPNEDVPLTLWGDVADTFRNTLHIYGKWGIHDDYADILSDAGFDHNFEKVYVADHYRAICDLVYAEISTTKINVLNTNEYIHTYFVTNWVVAENIIEIDKCFYLLDEINLIAPYLPKNRVAYLKKWIEFEKQAIIQGPE